MNRANGLNGRSFSGPDRKNTSADAKNKRGDWLAAKISEYSVQEIVEATGMTPKAVQNVRRRKSKLSYDNFMELCERKPEFAAAWAEHVGLLRPGEAEFAGALTQAFNAFQRRGE
jgi:hypothetical protein